MSILKILHYPDQRLRKIAHPVLTISHKTRNIIRDMFDTMYFQKGIGLAATQVNINQQIIVIDLHSQKKERLVFINPIIKKKIGTINIIEGCLSIPEVHDTVPRSKTIIVQSLNQYGNKFEITANDLLAVCIQHEIDHLFGILFIDYLTPLKINKILEKIQKPNQIPNN